MISADDALALTAMAFPAGPEALAAKLGIRIRESRLDGCDGWCIATSVSTVIRINSALSGVRKRFTLAHELGHLILGIPSTVGETVDGMLASKDDEEEEVNALASQLLVPAAVLRRAFPQPPVTAAAIDKLAMLANVSPLTVALRITNAAIDLGLVNAATVHFLGDEVAWTLSSSLRIKPQTAKTLRAGATRAGRSPYRLVQDDGRIVVASILDTNPHYGTNLFVQLLPPKQGLALSRDERRSALESALFGRGKGSRPRFEGCFGAFKMKAEKMTLTDAEAEFWSRYEQRFVEEGLSPELSREYVRLRLSEWCRV